MSPLFQNSLTINYKYYDEEKEGDGGNCEKRRICISGGIDSAGRREV